MRHLILCCLVGCSSPAPGARSVSPAGPGDTGPGTNGIVTGKCCDGDIASSNHVEFPTIDFDVTPQCVLGQAITHVHIQGTVAFCAGADTTAEFQGFSMTFTADRTQCGGSGSPATQPTCNVSRLNYHAVNHFAPEGSCVTSSDVTWVPTDLTGSDTTTATFCQVALHDLLLPRFDAEFITAAAAGSMTVANANGRPATCAPSTLVSVRLPRCGDWQQH